MSSEKRAAIDLDAIGEKQLSEISAADFLTALNAGGISAQVHHRIWPEKKKVELWAEPENLGGVKVGDLLNVIKAEKKKVELEKPPSTEIVKAVGVENVTNPRDLLRDPEFIGQVAREVANQLRFGR
jgi:hypothetical protein